jgi:tRNA A-37 threonylcarbamoyl transferase component Bud32
MNQRSDVERSPSDVLRLVVAAATTLVVVAVGHWFGSALTGFAADVLDGLDELPEWLVGLVVVCTQLLALGLLVVGGAIVVARRRWRLAATGAIAVGLALVLTALLTWAVAPPDDAVVDVAGWVPIEAGSVVSTATVALVVALTTAVAPWIARPWRRAWWAAALGVALAHALTSPIAFDTPMAVLAGWTGGAAAVVVLGAPSRRPTIEAVRDGLEAAGIVIGELHPAAVDARGSTPYLGRTADGTGLFVKTLGADERSADLLFRAFRAVQPHDLHDERPFSSLRRAVEHEALLALAARQTGVRTPPLLGVARAEPNGFTLAYDAIAGSSLDRAEPAGVTDDLLRAAWAQVAVLRRHRIAHRDLRLANLFLDDRGDLWIIDFGFSELAVDDLLLDGDVAELLASSSTVVGAERAVAAAVAVLGTEAVADSAHRLAPAFLSGATRTALASDRGACERLRTLAAGNGSIAPDRSSTLRAR